MAAALLLLAIAPITASQRGRRPVLKVWLIDGTDERTGISYQPLRYPTKLGAYGRDRNVNPWAFDAVASTGFDRLDSPEAAQVARDVHRAVLAKQGVWAACKHVNCRNTSWETPGVSVALPRRSGHPM